MKVDSRKTEYMCVNERQVKGTVKMPRRRGHESGGFQISGLNCTK